MKQFTLRLDLISDSITCIAAAVEHGNFVIAVIAENNYCSRRKSSWCKRSTGRNHPSHHAVGHDGLKNRKKTVAAGFEPTRPGASGFQVHLLNHSDKRPTVEEEESCYMYYIFLKCCCFNFSSATRPKSKPTTPLLTMFFGATIRSTLWCKL